MKIWRVMELINWTADYFKKNGIQSARLDAELLLGHILNKSRLQLYMDFDRIVAKEYLARYRELIKKRVERVPIAYLTNHKEFMSLSFYVDESVLIPRPETEVLVETVLKLQSDGSQVLDLGTGSGAIVVTLAKQRADWKFVATDISPEAIAVAKKNAQRYEVAERIIFLQSDLFESFDESMKFDYIVANPPYISSNEIPTLMPEIRDYEPRIAIDGGPTGLNFIDRLVAEAPKFLTENGQLVFEFGYQQDDTVGNLIQSNPQYTDCDIIKDYAGIERVVVARVGSRGG
ncbi:TPA: peptide chain release factor N(5)-glutamine methyltransferase [Candidatus Poribacteria bacterium]|nr:peptide chain release factor N(5)-glutamine methyltransferase [Candidatus Poribacteria bacterium]